MEPWSQHDEYSFMTESVSPLARTPAFWEHVMHNQVESGNLFSMTTPHVDTRLQPSTPTFYSYGCETSQGSDSTGSSYSDQQGERIKRRRMLQFTGVNTGGFAHDSPLPHESVVGSPSTTYSSSYAGSPLSSVFSGDDYMLQPYCSPGLTTSPWFTGSEILRSFQWVVTSRILLVRIILHNLGNDRHHSRHSLVFPKILISRRNSYHYKCNFSSLFNISKLNRDYCIQRQKMGSYKTL